MKNELISMVDFVQWIKFEPPKTDESHSNHFGYKFGAVCKYANFLNTPLNISMFVPAIKVGDKWEVLEEFNVVPYNGHTDSCDCLECNKMYKQYEQYQTAKDNVIFEGFYIVSGDCDLLYSGRQSFGIETNLDWKYYDGQTIQDLIKYKPTLTKKGLYVSGLNR